MFSKDWDNLLTKVYLKNWIWSLFTPNLIGMSPEEAAHFPIGCLHRNPSARTPHTEQSFADAQRRSELRRNHTNSEKDIAGTISFHIVTSDCSKKHKQKLHLDKNMTHFGKKNRDLEFSYRSSDVLFTEWMLQIINYQWQ